MAGCLLPVLLSLRSGPDGMAVVVHPTATAFLGLYFGPLAALISAAIALAAQLAIPQPPWGAAISVLAGAGLAGAATRWYAQQDDRPARLWISILVLAALLPLVTYACLVVSGAAPAPSSLQDALVRLPWYHGAGILLLGTGRQLLAGRVHSMQALREAHEALAQREEQLRLTLDSLNGGRWEWQVQRKEYRCEGHFYSAFGIEDTRAPDVWERWFSRRHPADTERTASYLARARMGLEEAYEAKFRVKNNAGQWRWIMSRGTVAERDAQGRPVRLAGMDVDITAHHEVEDALRASEAKSNADSTSTLPRPCGHCQHERGGVSPEANPALCALLGLPRHQAPGPHFARAEPVGHPARTHPATARGAAQRAGAPVAHACAAPGWQHRVGADLGTARAHQRARRLCVRLPRHDGKPSASARNSRPATACCSKRAAWQGRAPGSTT